MKRFHAQLNIFMYFKMILINGIQTFISMINTASERRKARNVFICCYLIFYKQLKFHSKLN